MKIPIHREGWPFIGVAIAANLILYLFSGWVALAFMPVTIWCVAFFRDPERVPPPGDNIIVSPADGKLLAFAHAAPPPELGMGGTPLLRLSIFMNVFNVHVNRVPADGTVVALAYRPGRFFNASFDKASNHNERMSIRLRLGNTAKELAVVQIAGLIARRIKCELAVEQKVQRGVRFGIIRFGSRLDVYLPAGAIVAASPGQHVKAGETILANFG